MLIYYGKALLGYVDINKSNDYLNPFGMFMKITLFSFFLQLYPLLPYFFPSIFIIYIIENCMFLNFNYEYLTKIQLRLILFDNLNQSSMCHVLVIENVNLALETDLRCNPNYTLIKEIRNNYFILKT